eukprot:2436303-Amphidinium_carterae.1
MVCQVWGGRVHTNGTGASQAEAQEYLGGLFEGLNGRPVETVGSCSDGHSQESLLPDASRSGYIKDPDEQSEPSPIEVATPLPED